MSDIEQTEDMAAKELAFLKERADVLGIAYKSNIGLEKLRARVNAKIQGAEDQDDVDNDLDGEDEGDDEGEAAEELQQALPKAPKAPKPRIKTKAEQEQELRETLQRECLALVRCKITNLNPAKADLGAELITVANKCIGTVTKLIPFGKATEKGYHIPKVIYDDLIARQFQQVFLTKNSQGFDVVDTRLVKEYAVEILPPLTPEELHELALAQQAAERMQGS